jgi:hypothetical protein
MGGNVTMMNKANTTQGNIVATEKLKNNLNVLPEIHEEFVRGLESDSNKFGSKLANSQNKGGDVQNNINHTEASNSQKGSSSDFQDRNSMPQQLNSQGEMENAKLKSEQVQNKLKISGTLSGSTQKEQNDLQEDFIKNKFAQSMNQSQDLKESQQDLIENKKKKYLDNTQGIIEHEIEDGSSQNLFSQNKYPTYQIHKQESQGS